MTHASNNATSNNATSNRNEENTMINQDAKINATSATYHPTNPNWPATLRIRLVAAILPDRPRRLGYVWTATDAGNGDKDATVNACNLAPKRGYTTRAAAIAAAKKAGWVVTSDTNAVSITRVNAQQPHRYRNYNTRGGIVMEIGQLEKTATLFNTCFDVGSHVVYYPSRHEDDIIIHRNGKRSYTKTKAFVRENTVVVFLEGIGNCDVRNVVSGATCSLDDVGFDKTFNHLW